MFCVCSPMAMCHMLLADPSEDCSHFIDCNLILCSLFAIISFLLQCIISDVKVPKLLHEQIFIQIIVSCFSTVFFNLIHRVFWIK